jgi:hypothetical protein
MLVLRKALFRFSAAKDTCLKQLHLDNGGKVVEFAGINSSTQDITSLYNTLVKE